MSWDTAALHAAMPFTALLGATAVAVAPDEVRLRLPWHADRCTAGGMLHEEERIGNARLAPLASNGPPSEPAALRVSTTRQGVRG